MGRKISFSGTFCPLNLVIFGGHFRIITICANLQFLLATLTYIIQFVCSRFGQKVLHRAPPNSQELQSGAPEVSSMGWNRRSCSSWRDIFQCPIFAAGSPYIVFKLTFCRMASCYGYIYRYVIYIPIPRETCANRWYKPEKTWFPW